MKVVFLQDVTNVAQAGEVKQVKDGFARNYLIPKKLAALATQNELQRVASIKKAAEQRRLKELEDWRKLGEALEASTVTLKARVGEEDKLYGSITNIMIAEELSKLTDRPIDRRNITLEEPIKALGSYEVPLHLHEGIDIKIKLVVEAEAT
ncbi:MAG: 50S ribosomal protein L9 [Chloroflexi bacterium]|nr:50S ribosomal protein L9 [Chloroflexota bacterium]